MPKNVMKLLKSVPNPSLHGFDLSHRHLMTANFGELLPVTCIETVPGDFIQMRVSDLLRAAPMVTSPFMRVKQHFDVWFTPYEDLWSNFESFMTQKYEPRHANNLGSFDFVPHLSLSEFVFAESAMTRAGYKDIAGRAWSLGAHKLFNYLGYGDASGVIPLTQNPSFNLWRIAQYNKIWYDEYRQQYYDRGLRFMNDSDFDSGYENPAAIFNFDDLKCDSQAHSNIADTTASFNIGTDEDSTYRRIGEMFQMRYRCWKKDLFTGVLPSTQFGAVSTVDLNIDSLSSFNLKTWNSSDSRRTLFVPANGGNLESTISTSTGSAREELFRLVDAEGEYNALVSSIGSSSPGTFDVLALRKSEAIQIWRERALTAGNRVGDNLRAHYGSDVDYNDHRSTFLGSVDAPLNIQDVNATAQTGQDTNGALGDVAGKGLSSMDEKVFKFKAKKFGCIMVMFSLLPEAEYNAFGIDRMNQLLESEDYFVPEYENLGLEAVSTRNFYLPSPSVIGYAPRYYGYKQKLDKVFGDFISGRQFAHWASPKNDVTNFFADNPDNNYMPLSLLYVNPALYDNNFAVSVDNSDQVLCDFFFEVSALRPMTVSGLPNY